MQDPNADTQWNDILRAKGILPPKDEITEEDIIGMVEQTVQQKTQGKGMGDMDLDELNELEDEIDEDEERVFEEYRRKRLQELQEALRRNVFGSVVEISKADYVDQVNKAGDDVWVVVHVYKDSIPLCKLINLHLTSLARRFASTKFVKSVSTVCIPNYPDKNLPTVFVYLNGDMKKQFIGPLEFGGMNLKEEDLEWMLGQAGAVPTQLEENPRKPVHDALQSAIHSSAAADKIDDENDW